jgi:hypothetical protein
MWDSRVSQSHRPPHTVTWIVVLFCSLLVKADMRNFCLKYILLIHLQHNRITNTYSIIFPEWLHEETGYFLSLWPFFSIPEINPNYNCAPMGNSSDSNYKINFLNFPRTWLFVRARTACRRSGSADDGDMCSPSGFRRSWKVLVKRSSVAHVIILKDESVMIADCQNFTPWSLIHIYRPFC